MNLDKHSALIVPINFSTLPLRFGDVIGNGFGFSPFFSSSFVNRAVYFTSRSCNRIAGFAVRDFVCSMNDFV